MATIYIDPTVGGPGAGTLGDPFQSWASVTWTNGNTYLQRAGTTFVGSVTANNSVTIGSYDPATGQPTTTKATINATGQARGVRCTGASNQTIQDIEVYGATSECFYYDTGAGTNRIVQRCKARDSAGTAFKGYGTVKILYCEAERVTFDQVYLEGDACEVGWCRLIVPADANANADCIQVADSLRTSSNCWIHDNYLDHSASPNKQCVIIQNTGATGVTLGIMIERNECLHISTGSVTTKAILAILDSAIIRANNVIGGDWGIGLQGANGAVYGNVVICDAQMDAGVLVEGNGSSGFNNTIVGPATSGISATGATTRNIYNNIVSGAVTGLNQGTNVTDDYNDYYNCTTVGGNGGNDLTVDPQLDSSYKPGNSALRTAGTYLGGLDYYGKEFQSPPSVGAIQWQGARAIANSRQIVARTITSRSIVRRGAW